MTTFVPVGKCHFEKCKMYDQRQEILVYEGEKMPCFACKGPLRPTGEVFDKALLSMHKRARGSGGIL